MGDIGAGGARALGERISRSLGRLEVYSVAWDPEVQFPSEVDSLWRTPEDAAKRAGELGDRWGVLPWEVKGEWRPSE